VTPAPGVSQWTVNTLEQARIQKRLLEIGVELVLSSAVSEATPDGVTITNAFTGREATIAADSLVAVTGRLPTDELVQDLESHRDQWESAGLQTVRAIGDAWAPGTIAAAVWDGHRYARELDVEIDADIPPFRREITGLAREA
ncbi:MAG: NADH:flavin oxidoreductase, partial [Acidimicrobiia bacterium]